MRLGGTANRRESVNKPNPMNITELTELCDEAEAKIKLSRAAFPRIMEIERTINAHYFYYYPEQAKIIARVPARTDFAPLRALHTGKWDKDINDDEGVTTACYRAYSDDGVEMVVRVCELPPSCKIVREEIEVPAREAHTKIVEKVICDGVTREEVLAEASA